MRDLSSTDALTWLAALLAGACSSAAPAAEGPPDATTTARDAGTDSASPPRDASGPDSSDAGVPEAAVGSGCSGANTLCWGFEEGATTPPGWSVGRTDYGAVVLPDAGIAHAGPALVVDATRPHAGRYSLHASAFAGGTPGSQGGPKATIVYTLPAHFGPVLWGRMFVFLAPAAPDSHAGLFNARYAPPGSTATAMATLDWYEVASYQQKYMTVWHPPEPPGYPENVQLSDASVVLQRFVCLEWLFDGTPGDGGQGAAPRLWLDGVELSWPDPFTYPDGSAPPPRDPVDSFLELETGVYLYQGLPAPTDWWIDDLAVGPARIGCG